MGLCADCRGTTEWHKSNLSSVTLSVAYLLLLYVAFLFSEWKHLLLALKSIKIEERHLYEQLFARNIFMEATFPLQN